MQKESNTTDDSKTANSKPKKQDKKSSNSQTVKTSAKTSEKPTKKIASKKSSVDEVSKKVETPKTEKNPSSKKTFDLSQKLYIIINILLFPIAYVSLSLYNFSSLTFLGLLILGLVFAISGAATQVINSNKSLKLNSLLVFLTLIFITLIVLFSTGIKIIQEQELQINLFAALVSLLSFLGLWAFYFLLKAQIEAKENFNLADLMIVQRIFKGPSLIFSLIVAALLTASLLGMLSSLNQSELSWLSDKFLKRGIIPPITLFFFFWGALLLLGKFFELRQYSNIMNKKLETNQENNFKNSKSLKAIFFQTLQKFKDKSSFESNNSLLDVIWQKSYNFYEIPKYINWSIPLLGFIGTVLGISLSSAGIQKIISSEDGLTSSSASLGEALAPLGIAFDTTLIALSLSIVLALIHTLIEKWENAFIDKIHIYLNND